MFSLKGAITPVHCVNCHQLQTQLMKLCRTNVRHGAYMSTQTHYEVLSVTKTASQRDIKDAFIKLSKKTHPDLNPNNPDKHNKFVRINEAYEILSSPVKRKEYDENLSFGSRFGPNYPNAPFSQSHYKTHSQNRQRQYGSRPHQRNHEDYSHFNAGGYYDPKTGKHHINDDGSTASMSPKDWQNVFRFAKYLALFVVLNNCIYIFLYVKNSNAHTKRHQDYYTDPRNGYRHNFSRDHAEIMKLHEEKLRRKKRKQKNEKKVEDVPKVDPEILHYDVPTPSMR